MRGGSPQCLGHRTTVVIEMGIFRKSTENLTTVGGKENDADRVTMSRKKKWMGTWGGCVTVEKSVNFQSKNVTLFCSKGGDPGMVLPARMPERGLGIELCLDSESRKDTKLFAPGRGSRRNGSEEWGKGREMAPRGQANTLEGRKGVSPTKLFRSLKAREERRRLLKAFTQVHRRG